MENLTVCPVCEKSSFSPFLKGEDYFLTNEEFFIVSCDHCRMKFLNPRPGENEIGRYYESPDYVSHGGEKNTLNFLYRQVRKFSLQQKYRLVKKVASGTKLLDIGCGTGEFLHHCKQKGLTVSGIEPGTKPRTFARDKYNLEVSGESVLEEMNQPRFDVITLWHVLEHVHLLRERMKKITEILNPDGTIIIAVPNSDSWDALHYGKFWAAYDLPRHLYHFTGETMKILAEKHKLEIFKVIPMKLDAFYISLLSEKYYRGKQNYFNAVVNGIRSNNFAARNNSNYSSLIFVLKTKKAPNNAL
jgi:2-polyprenyl-3-methyl-5-hydroxy-6-metoxy-1,4-benzoquinol methylase